MRSKCEIHGCTEPSVKELETNSSHMNFVSAFCFVHAAEYQTLGYVEVGTSERPSVSR